MATLPLIRDTNPGIYQVCVAANTDYAIAIPKGAKWAQITFVRSTTDNTMIWGRVGFDETAGAQPITDTSMAHQAPMPMQYDLGSRGASTGGLRHQAEYLHVACATAGAVVKGSWLFASDAGEEA